MHISRSLALTLFLTPLCLAVPLSFEQRDAGHFLARFANRTIELRPDCVILPDVTMRFTGGTGASRLEGLGPAAPSTYLRAGVARTFPQFPKLAIRNLYRGIDAVFYGSGENLEYDLEIAAGASPYRIRISLEGARHFHIDGTGNLTIETASGVLRQMRPRVFQGNRGISARYVLLGSNTVGIRLGRFNPRLPLTIDPVLAYVKSLGASGSSAARAIALDAQGNIYTAGQSNAADFPTTSNSYQSRITPPLQVVSNAGQTIRPLPVGLAGGVTVVSGTPDGRILFAATASGIFLSGDSGATWRQTAPLPVPATVYQIALDPLDPATILVATSRGLFGSNSGGQVWGARNTGLPVSATGSAFATSVFYSPVNPLIAYATTSMPAYLFASADAGASWQRLDPTYPGEPPAPTLPYPPVGALLTPDGKTLFAINGNGTLLKSGDGGASWVKLAQGLYGPIGFGSIAIKLDPNNANTLYVLDEFGLQKSTDGGLTFSMITTPAKAREFAIDSSGALYVGGVNLIYASTDGGKTFAAVPRLSSFEVTALTELAGSVYVGSTSASVPFVTKLDPSGSNILYSTFLGGSAGDGVSGLAVDAQGNAVLVGSAVSPDFPLTVPAPNPPSPDKPDGFVAKLNADGTRLLYSIAVGGSKPSSVQAVAVDSSGAAFITGQTRSTDFPTTANAFQPAIPPTPCARPQVNLPVVPVNTGNYAFVTRISADGKSLAYSTFLTGSCGSSGQGIAIDAAGDAIVVGSTTSPDFPVSSNSYQPSFPGDTKQVSPPGIFDAGFVARISPTGDKMIAGSYLGGGFATQANAVALDAAGNAYITGSTQGFVPGATPGAFQTKPVDLCAPPFFIGPSLPYTGTPDGFVLKLDAALSSARFLTYLGGSCSDSGSSIALDAAGNIWIAGVTQSPDFPVKDPFQAGGPGGGFVSQLSPDAAQLLFSSFSDGSALALSPTAAYLAGAGGTSALVAKIDPAITPAIGIDSAGPVTAFPTLTVGPFSAALAPGLLIQITGRNLGPSEKVNAQLDASGRLPFVLSNTVVFFDHIPAPLISVQSSSITCFVPFEAASTAQITVLSNGQRSNGFRVTVQPSAPQIMSIANQDGTPNSAGNPARAGSVIAVYVSGLGETTPLSVDGLVNAAPLPVPLVPVSVFVPGGTPGSPPDAVSAAIGLIAGITQVNVRLPVPITARDNVVVIGVNSASATVYVTQ
jgi:uncharacterized protein (TIGR03437 family)